MAKFDPPFSNSADFRFPTNDEQNQGFPCGPADREMFNGLFHRIEAEIGEVISYAGLTGDNADLTQLRQAIVDLIDAATGGGDPTIYLLMAQARARLPIYPEVLNTDGKIVVTSPATGTVRLPGGVSFQHRGIWPVTTVQTDFETVASKTYHLRWNPTDGFTLKDLSNAVYNPGALAEIDRSFDSGYDDMLIARIITNSSNLATITNLSNKPELWAQGEEVGAMGGLTQDIIEDNIRPSQITKYQAVDINFARTPIAYLTAVNDVNTANTPGLNVEKNLGVRALSRYRVAVWAQGDRDMWVGWAART